MAQRVSGQSFIGSALNGVDAKNRVSVPSSFRDVVTARTGGSELYVGPGLREGSLVGYDALYAAELQARHDQRFGASDGIEREDDGMSIFSAVERLSIDAAGRIVLSASMLSWSGIDGHALFLSGGQRFFIWNPFTLLRQPNLPPQVVATARGHLAAKGLA